MDSRSIYVVKRKNEISTIFSGGDGTVRQKKFSGTSFLAEEIIAENVMEHFSLNISEKGDLFMFCLNSNNSLTLYSTKNDKWTSKVLQQGIVGDNIHFHAIIDLTEIYLLFNAPSTSGYNLLFQKMSGGKWSGADIAVEGIAKINPPFLVQNIAKNHYITYFQTSEKENALCCKEFYLPDKWGTLKTLNITNFSYLDISVVTAKNGIHAAFIIRGSYSCRLAYVSKQESGSGNTVILFESPKIEKTSLFIYKNNIYVIFECANNMFYWTYSKDNGATFTRPVRIKVSGANYAKAVFLSDTPQSSETSVLYDLFTDIENPGEMEILTSIYTDFFNISATAAEQKESASDDVDANKHVKRESSKKQQQDDILKEKMGEITILRNKLDSARKELSAKDKQILEMNYTISQKKNEMAETNIKLRDTVKKLQKELELKTKAEERLTGEIELLKKELLKEAVLQDIDSENKTDGTDESILTDNV